MPKRKHIDAAVLDKAMKKARRREQWRRASKRKRVKKKQTLALSTHLPKTALEHLSSGEFPDFRPIEAMGKLGLTNNEISEVLGVAKVTFQKWISRSPRLRAALLRGRKVADTHVADSLYKQAIGFSVPEEKIFYDSKRGQVVRAESEHYYPPNTVATIFWLKNRYSEFWREHKSDEQAAIGPMNVQQVKFVLVQSSGSSAKSSEKVIDGDYQIIQPNASPNGGTSPTPSGE